MNKTRPVRKKQRAIIKCNRLWLEIYTDFLATDYEWAQQKKRHVNENNDEQLTTILIIIRAKFQFYISFYSVACLNAFGWSFFFSFHSLAERDSSVARANYNVQLNALSTIFTKIRANKTCISSMYFEFYIAQFSVHFSFQ